MTRMEQTTAEQKDIRILVIESSCGEAATAVVESGRTVRPDVTYSQVATHTLYGSVVLEIASRTHVKRISRVTAQTLTDAGLTSAEIDAIGVTYRPGFMGPLLTGVSAAKAMAFVVGKPLIGVNHIGGHVLANFIASPDLKPPFLYLIVSGGHTNLVMAEDYGKFRTLGQTRDDAAGEAFNKVTRSVELGYPGGPKIDRKAREGNPDTISFPRAGATGSPYDFSFSGLKSVMLNYQNHAEATGGEIPVADLVVSFRKAVVEVLIFHTMEATRDFSCKTIATAGGIATNSALHEAMWLACEIVGYTLIYPEPGLCTDNTTIIGSATCYEYCTGGRSGQDLDVVPNLKPGRR